MKFNFVDVDAHGQQLGTIVQNLQDNLTNLQNLKNELMTEFQGAGATGYEGVMDTLQNKINNYNTSLGNVRTAISQTSGSDGIMRITDSTNGAKFHM